MSDEFELRYLYKPPRPEPEPGVTSGYIVLWDGTPGKAMIAETAQIVDFDGTRHLIQIGDFAPTTVVDDDPD